MKFSPVVFSFPISSLCRRKVDPESRLLVLESPDKPVKTRSGFRFKTKRALLRVRVRQTEGASVLVERSASLSVKRPITSYLFGEFEISARSRVAVSHCRPCLGGPGTRGIDEGPSPRTRVRNLTPLLLRAPPLV